MGSIISLDHTVFGRSILNSTFRVRGTCYLMTYGSSFSDPISRTSTLVGALSSCPTSRVLNFNRSPIDNNTISTNAFFREEELINPVFRVVEVKRSWGIDSSSEAGIRLDVSIEIISPNRILGSLCQASNGFFSYSLVEGHNGKELNSSIPAIISSRLERL